MRKSRISATLLFLLLSQFASVANSEDEDWFIRIIVEAPAEQLIDRANILGRTSSSLAAMDAHDLPERAPFGETYLSVVFKHDDWGEDSGEYNSDFRSLDDPNSVWRFTVKSDDPNRALVLKWEGEKYLDQMVMIDELTGLEFYPVIGGIAQEYAFNMGGFKERNFLWKR